MTVQTPTISSLVATLATLGLAPLLSGLILKVKALLAGRKGSPLTIHYHTLRKLLRKTPVVSSTTTFVFRLGPVVSLTVPVLGLCFMPLAGLAPLISFPGDAVVVCYLFGLARFFTILAALDTGSSFEGMGAAREAFFAVLAEATLFALLVLFSRLAGTLSLGGFFLAPAAVSLWRPDGAVLLLAVAALFMILLTENSRLPVDDPATHLELTMIHEVMVLDHSGPDLAMIELGAQAKLLFYATLIANLLLPAEQPGPIGKIVLFVAATAMVYVLVGVGESITARFKLSLVPKFILTSFALAFFAVILSMEFAL